MWEEHGIDDEIQVKRTAQTSDPSNQSLHKLLQSIQQHKKKL